MIRNFAYKIEEEYKGYKISRFLTEKGFSSHCLTWLRHKEGCILLNGTPVFMNHVLSTDDELKIEINENINSPNIVPVKLPVNIVYEDEDIIVLNKPANMPIHPSQNNRDNSLANALQYYYNSRGENFVFRCVNRLDKNTSGLTVVAKNMVSSGIMSEAIAGKAEGGFLREYAGIVRGELSHKAGTIDAPIARVDGSTIERTVDFEKGEQAITHYETLGTKEVEKAGKSEVYSLVKFRLETGRTHQIRVHLKYIGYPLIGDHIYNPDFEMMERHALHAFHLKFTHPVSKEEMEFVTELPEDMKWIK